MVAARPLPPPWSVDEQAPRADDAETATPHFLITDGFAHEWIDSRYGICNRPAKTPERRHRNLTGQTAISLEYCDVSSKLTVISVLYV
jgi:hypothetical protein